jgi:predicted Zn-dependent protease
MVIIFNGLNEPSFMENEVKAGFYWVTLYETQVMQASFEGIACSKGQRIENGPIGIENSKLRDFGHHPQSQAVLYDD